MELERKKDLALGILEMRLIEKGLPGKEIRREAGDIASKLNELGYNTNADEIVNLIKSCVPRVLGRIFGYQKVHLEMTEPHRKKFPC